MPRRLMPVLVLAAALGVVAAACGGGSAGSPSAPPASGSAGESGGTTLQVNGEAANDHGSKDVSGSTSVDLEAGDFYFGPTVLKGTPGEKVTIRITNSGTTVHNFSIDGEKIDQDVQPGQRSEVTVTFPDSGTLTFYCKYHRTLGMVGGLEVG